LGRYLAGKPTGFFPLYQRGLLSGDIHCGPEFSKKVGRQAEVVGGEKERTKIGPTLAR
jgi:hypothetical protein